MESPGEEFFKKYMGGTNMIGYYLNTEVPGDVDALAPENKIIVSPSIMTGAAIPGFSRFSVGAKSPLTNGFGNSDVITSYSIHYTKLYEGA